MQIRYFAHSWLSDWNHGNAHFLRGLADELGRRGHSVRLYEPMPSARGGWSLENLLAEPEGTAAVSAMRAAYPQLDIRLFGPGAANASLPGPPLPRVAEWAAELRHADVVLVHEWMEPGLLPWLLRQRRRFGFRLLLHDTHHRAATDRAWIERLPLRALDGVLAFGESLRQIYERLGARRTFTLHEAADLRRFGPRRGGEYTADALWIGNWGDEERTWELETFLWQPLRAAGVRAHVYGVRYPPEAQTQLRKIQVAYRGYLPNLATPEAYAAARLALHIPRRPYVAMLPGIPTIRMFEALACGAALLSAPWTDSERLFAPGDYRIARDGIEMETLMVQLLASPEQRSQLGRHGAATIAARHTCAHRAAEFESLCAQLE